jgi:plastocyanin
MRRLHYLVGILATAALSACGSDGSDINQPSNRPANSISIVDQAETRGAGAFNPNPLNVSLGGGGVVSWYNDDEQPAGGQYGGSTGTIHNIASDDLSFSSGNIRPRARFQHTVDVAGTYDYHCSIHPTMRGTIIVAP